MVVTKIAIKNQEKANNSPSYRCAAIKKTVQINVKVSHVNKKPSSNSYNSYSLNSQKTKGSPIIASAIELWLLNNVAGFQSLIECERDSLWEASNFKKNKIPNHCYLVYLINDGSLSQESID